MRIVLLVTLIIILILAVIGRSGHNSVGNIYKLSLSSYTNKSAINFGTNDRTGDIEFQGHDKFLVLNHMYHWDGHNSGYLKLSKDFTVVNTINTGENNYIFCNNSNKVIIIASNSGYIQYGDYTDNGNTISLGTLTRININMNSSIAYLDKNDETLYVYVNGGKIRLYDTNNQYRLLGECNARDRFDLDRPHSISYCFNTNLIISSISTTSIVGLIVNNNGQSLISITRQEETFFNTSDANITADNVLENKIAYSSIDKVIGTMPNNGNLEYTPSDEEQTIPKGYVNGGRVKAVDITTLDDYNRCLELSKAIITNEEIFTPLEYIESNGNQCIDTKIKMSNIYEIEIDLSISDTGTNTTIISASNVWNNSNYIVTIENGYQVWNYYTSTVSKTAFGQNSRHLLNIYRDQIYIDSILKVGTGTNIVTNADTNATNLYIFCNNQMVNKMNKAKIYSFKLLNKETNNYILDCVPAINKITNVVGLLDKNSNYFYTSILSNFIAGPIVSGGDN